MTRTTNVPIGNRNNGLTRGSAAFISVLFRDGAPRTSLLSPWSEKVTLDYNKILLPSHRLTSVYKFISACVKANAIISCYIEWTELFDGCWCDIKCIM
jgi:hypothetical protein